MLQRDKLSLRYPLHHHLGRILARLDVGPLMLQHGFFYLTLTWQPNSLWFLHHFIASPKRQVQISRLNLLLNLWRHWWLPLNFFNIMGVVRFLRRCYHTQYHVSVTGTRRQPVELLLHLVVGLLRVDWLVACGHWLCPRLIWCRREDGGVFRLEAGWGGYYGQGNVVYLGYVDMFLF